MRYSALIASLVATLGFGYLTLDLPRYFGLFFLIGAIFLVMGAHDLFQREHTSSFVRPHTSAGAGIGQSTRRLLKPGRGYDLLSGRGHVSIGRADTRPGIHPQMSTDVG